MMRFNPVWLAAVAMAGVLPAMAPAQSRQDRAATDRPPIYAGGTDIFRYLFHHAAVEPIDDTHRDLEINGDFSDYILVIIGDDRGLGYERHVGRVLRGGGAVLLAMQSHTELSRLFPLAQDAVITGDEVVSEAAGSNLGGHPECPFAVPLEPRRGQTGPEWQLFRGLNRIATNQPSYFRLNNPGFGGPRNSLAGFPKGSRVNWAIGRMRANDPDRDVLAIGGSRNFPNTHRFLAVADPSIFFNEMMVPVTGEETDNLEFAHRVVRFLSEDGKRTKCLFVQNGHITRDFSSLAASLRPEPPPIQLPNLWQLQEKIVDAGNQIIDKFQENGGPSSLVMGRHPVQQYRRLRELLRALLVIGSICVVWFLVRRVWRARQPTDIPPAPSGGRMPTSSSDRPPPGVFQRRQREVLRRNNLHEPVRIALREFFAGTGAPADAGSKLPKVVIADFVRRSDTLRKALADLWRIAYGPPTVVTVQKWKLLEPIFDRVQKAHADGKWRFVVAEELVARGSEA